MITFTPCAMDFTHQHQQWDREAYNYAGDVYTLVFYLQKMYLPFCGGILDPEALL